MPYAHSYKSEIKIAPSHTWQNTLIDDTLHYGTFPVMYVCAKPYYPLLAMAHFGFSRDFFNLNLHWFKGKKNLEIVKY